MNMRSLETSAYYANTFSDILNKIQKALDDLSLHAWVANLDEVGETMLAGRLDAGIRFVLILLSRVSCPRVFLT